MLTEIVTLLVRAEVSPEFGRWQAPARAFFRLVHAAFAWWLLSLVV